MIEELSKVLVKFDEKATAESLRSEYTKFVPNWDGLKLTLVEFYEAKRI